MRKPEKDLIKLINKYGDRKYIPLEVIAEEGISTESYNYLLSSGCLKIVLTFGDIEALQITPYGKSIKEHKRKRRNDLIISGFVSLLISIFVAITVELIKMLLSK